MRYLLATTSLALLLRTASVAQTVEIALNEQQLAPVQVPFHVERVIDARPDRTRLGKVYRGLDNRPVSATLGRALPEELTPLLQHALPGPVERYLSRRVARAPARIVLTHQAEAAALFRADLDRVEALTGLRL